jgi:hypothetical protein
MIVCREALDMFSITTNDQHNRGNQIELKPCIPRFHRIPSFSSAVSSNHDACEAGLQPLWIGYKPRRDLLIKRPSPPRKRVTAIKGKPVMATGLPMGHEKETRNSGMAC